MPALPECFSGCPERRYCPRAAVYFFGAGDCFGGALALGDEEVAGAVDAGAEADGAGDGCDVGVGVGADGSGAVDWTTEWVPVTAGRESISASSTNEAAAPIVIFESSDVVPRGPNAVLDTLLENSAPASDLPGCSSITTTRMTHARMNSPYKA
jgi:hypothetical protein